MRLWAGPTQQFIEDTVQNLIADKLQSAYENYYGRRVGPSEKTSWTNSLQFVKNIVEKKSLQDTAVVLEYELPYTNERIDCIIFGKGAEGNDNVVVLELKQWSEVEDCDVEGNVITFVGRAQRMVPHPSFQVRGYHFLLKDFVQLFDETPPTELSSCVYCHNYQRVQDDVLFLPKFRGAIRDFPLFVKEDVEKLGEYLKARLAQGKGLELLNRFSRSAIRPSKKLLEHTRAMIQGQKAFTLIDEQITAYNTILDRAKKSAKVKTKSVIIVRGGPGTGKSVIALNVLAELLSKGLTVFHATGSAAFTTTVRRIVGTRAANHFKYFNSFPNRKENEINVLICDEAHRIRKSSNSRYTKRELRSNTPQVEELMKVAKVTIFFIDDRQIVRPDEIGSSKLLKETASKFGAEVFDFELKTQFRCSGSDGYLNWIDNTLELRETANRMLTRSEKMEFRIFDSPHALHQAIKQKNREKANSARLVAGFCWPWSDANLDGTLKEDVVIGDFKITWEAKNDAKKLAPGIPKASLWAYDPNGVHQAGSIYTIQGFEFDYVGVIFGPDLRYNAELPGWEGNPKGSADKNVRRAKGDEFTELVKNTYRVLLTRGMKGCYAYFMDRDAENFVRSRIETAVEELVVSTQEIDDFLRDVLSDEEIKKDQKYSEYLPVFSLEAVATNFGREDYWECLGWKKLNSKFKLNKDLFIARVAGKSMEPTIRDGSYCVFRKSRGGSRDGLIVLAASEQVTDPEHSLRFTLKRYHSEKEIFDDGTWRHKKITLSPDNKTFENIVLENIEPDSIKIVAEFVEEL